MHKLDEWCVSRCTAVGEKANSSTALVGTIAVLDLGLLTCGWQRLLMKLESKCRVLTLLMYRAVDSSSKSEARRQ